MADLDFAGLNAQLLGQADNLMQGWLPGGKRRGKEYVCASLQGGKGESLSVNLTTGAWAEFNGGAKGGDLISLYAAIYGMGQGDAFRALAGPSLAPALKPATLINGLSETAHVDAGIRRTVPASAPSTLGPPPAGTQGPAALFDATAHWLYRDAAGAPLFYVTRHDEEGAKSFRPWSWDTAAARWVCKGWPTPRPLYQLDRLAAHPEAVVIVVEGEKAASCDALRALEPAYVATTWPNGAAAVSSADWSALAGRKVIVWPDADEPGRKAGDAIIKALRPIAADLSLIDTHDLADGFDAADLTEPFLAWSKYRLTIPVTPSAVPRPNEATLTIAEDAAELPESVAVLCETYGLATMGKSGLPLCNVENALRVLDVVPNYTGLVWWDEFHERLFTPPGREWSDRDTLALLVKFQRELGFQRLSDEMLYKSLIAYGAQHSRNEPAEWMRSLTWDGKPRIDTYFTLAFGARDCDYTRAASRNWWRSMVARVLRPGCKVDTMVILEGKQGAGKSRALSIIGGKWFSEIAESVTSKDFYLCLSGKFLLEIGELDAFSRAEVNRIKQVITSQSDRYRAPYGRAAEDHARKCVFVGTTNESHYLRDSTGGRRFWPIETGYCAPIDFAYITDSREQCFAEAVAQVQANETWWDMPQAETEDMQESRRQADEWEITIKDFVDRFPEGVTLGQVWADCFQGKLTDFDRREQHRIGNALRALGWRNSVIRQHGQPVRLWKPPLTE